MPAEGPQDQVTRIVPAPPAREVQATASIERARAPRPGVLVASFRWHDVLHSPPPARKRHGEGSYVLYHGMEVGNDLRLTYSTVVSVDPGASSSDPLDDDVRVDSRLSVQRRTLLALIDWERAWTDRVTAHWRERTGRRLVAQRSVANRVPWPWARKATQKLIRWEALLLMASIRGTRRVMRGLVAVPDALVTRAIRAETHLSGRFDRRRLLLGLTDPAALTTEQKGVVLFLASAALVGLVFLLNTLFALVLPRFAAGYQIVFRDATVSVLGTLAVPIAIEPLVAATTLKSSPLIAFSGFFLGKMIAVWFLYVIGDGLHGAIEKITATRARLKKAVDWFRREADNRGFWLLIIVNAAPLVPDAILYAFAVSGMKFRAYMGGIALGTTVKLAAIVGGVVFQEEIASAIGAVRGML